MDEGAITYFQEEEEEQREEGEGEGEEGKQEEGEGEQVKEQVEEEITTYKKRIDEWWVPKCLPPKSGVMTSIVSDVILQSDHP